MPKTTTLSRKKTEINDILTWIECFYSYISVITAFQPERIRDLLVYMALIMRMASNFQDGVGIAMIAPFVSKLLRPIQGIGVKLSQICITIIHL